MRAACPGMKHNASLAAGVGRCSLVQENVFSVCTSFRCVHRAYIFNPVFPPDSLGSKFNMHQSRPEVKLMEQSVLGPFVTPVPHFSQAIQPRRRYLRYWFLFQQPRSMLRECPRHDYDVVFKAAFAASEQFSAWGLPPIPA